jgi:tetratricopeptide (TPR) repeat protein
VSQHFSRFVLIDEPSLREEIQANHAAFMIDHEFACPKCGAVEQYALSPIEWIRLMQMDEDQILAMLQNRQPDKPLRPHPRVFYMRSQAFGRLMHPLDIVSEYRGRIALNPKNADLHSGLGDTLRYMGRYEQALESYRKAVELAPLNTTFLFEAATAEHDFGDLQAARALYERCLSTGSIQGIGQVGEVARASMQGLKALEKGERSPWNYQLINASGVRLLPPPRTWPAGVAGPKKDHRHKRH